MILAFSTSCAWSSVAAIDRKSGVTWHGSKNAPHGASGACLELIQRLTQETGVRVEDAELFAADIGPGSFTGVRVGVTLAKTFGYLYDRPVTGATSFDLVSPDMTVVLPSKKGEFFIRHPGSIAERSVDLPDGPFVGFGPGIDPQTPPDASRFALILDRLLPSDAMTFAPEYLIEPSISIPKKPYASSAGTGA